MGGNSFWSLSKMTIERNWFTSRSSRSFQERRCLEIFLVLSDKRCIRSINKLKVDRKYYFFIIVYFHLYYIGIFAFSTNLVLNFYDYMRYPFHERLAYGSLMAHLGKLVQSAEVNQFIYVNHSILTQFKFQFIEEFTILLSQVKPFEI